MDVDIEVKMHDVSAWKVNTTSFTLKVYAKDTTYCEYRTLQNVVQDVENFLALY